MSSLFNQASLVVEPAVYESGKVYATKPFDGSGDLTFSRASNATRVGPDGLIEKVRENLILQSNTFSTTWVNSNSTETSGQAGYDGTNNAWLLDKTGTNGYIGQTVSYTGLYTQSIYVKAGTSNWLAIQNAGLASSLAYFDLQNGVIGSAQANVLYHKIESIGSGWYRCSAAYNGASGQARFFVADSDNVTSGTSGNILIQAAQFEVGDVMTDYIATTTAAVSVGPVSGLPRLDYLNSSCPRLLLEPAATALNQFSESFDDSYWQLKTDVTISANTTDTLDPSGYYGADKITETATTARHRVASNVTNLTTTNHTASVFMKKGTARYGFVTFAGGTVFTIVVDLDDGTITNTSTSGTIVAQKVENYGNGWYRISVTGLSSISGSSQYNLQFGSAGSATPSYVANIPSFAGSTSNYLYAWGANLTATNYLQSYLPTLSTSVTRVAESASKTGISSLIGQTEGTLFCDVQWVVKPESGSPIVSLVSLNNANNLQNCIILGIERNSDGTNRFYSFVQVSNSTTVALIGSNLTSGRYKAAMAYKANDFVLYVNGVQIATDTSGALPTTSEIIVGGRFVTDSFLVSDPISQALLFKTRLTNAQLAELTTL